MKTEGFSKMASVGGYLPQQIVKTDDLMQEIKSEQRFGIRHSWLREVVGVDEMRVSSTDTRPSDLALEAAKVAVADSDIDGKDIELVIYCGIDRDWCEPATAHRIQNEIAPNAICFDVTNACHGFMNGIAIANSMMGNGACQTALIVTGETPTRVTSEALRQIELSQNKEDFKRWLGALTVGDSGAAMLLTAKTRPDEGFQQMNFFSDGQHTDLCYYTKGADDVMEGQMLMKPISDAILGMHRDKIDTTYDKLAWRPDNVDTLVAHQVGERPAKTLAKIADISFEKTTKTFRRLGNLVSATIPVNLWLNPPKKGDKVLILGTGSGLSISQSGIIF